MNAGYDPDVCDLCGSRACSVLVGLSTGRAMRSDRATVPFDLLKLECRRCGLVRDGRARTAGELDRYYGSEYSLSVNPEEHVFYTTEGPVRRSRMLAEWLTSAAPEAWPNAGRILEVGAGAGHLLGELQARFPGAAFEGIEHSGRSVGVARQHGRNVRRADLGDVPSAAYDLAYSVAVVEHVASPTRWLRVIHERLRPGGRLVLCQPTQDVPSYDVLFVDHVHHFGTAHVEAYARKTGFAERRAVVGHRWMPNFSLHVLEAVSAPPGSAWEGPWARTTCRETAERVLGDMRRLDATLARLRAEGRRVAVLGLTEVFALAQAYSSLRGFPLVCGLDDAPDRPEYASLGFPVLVPERCVEMRVQDVILAANRVYHAQLIRRMEALGLVPHPVLS